MDAPTLNRIAVITLILLVLAISVVVARRLRRQRRDDRVGPPLATYGKRQDQPAPPSPPPPSPGDQTQIGGTRTPLADRIDEQPAPPPPPPAVSAPRPAPPMQPQPAPGTTRGIPADALDRLREQETFKPATPRILPAEQQSAAPEPDADVTLTLSDLQPAPVPAVEPARFSAYYPKELTPNTWHTLLAYVFRVSAADAVAADARTELGERLAAYRTPGADARAPLAEGALITATPQLDGFQFNPPSITVGLYEQWQRLDFKLRAASAPLDASVNGQITFTVEGVIVADVPLSIYVSATAAASAPQATPTAAAYNAVFCSYSRKDRAIIERVERAYRALGIDYLRDLVSIRAGEEWSDALKGLIDRADVFQLFWSSNSAPSKHVEMEWRYALSLLPERPRFIRPVYWEMPMPPVPDALGDIHFAYQPDLDDA